MKSGFVCSVLCTTILIAPVLTMAEGGSLGGPYLGQKPPSLIPEVFAPGIISKAGSRELMHGFFDNDKLFILYRYPIGFKGT